ncbi:hypothetical protein ES703_107129 [subsurface metagenome]
MRYLGFLPLTGQKCRQAFFFVHLPAPVDHLPRYPDDLSHFFLDKILLSPWLTHTQHTDHFIVDGLPVAGLYPDQVGCFVLQLQILTLLYNLDVNVLINNFLIFHGPNSSFFTSK